MGNKGSNTTTQTTAPDSQAMAAYRALLDRATAVASQPYSPYGGELTAPINTQQQLGIGNINQAAGFAQPYIQQAAGYATELGQGPSADDLAHYQNPYTQQVVDATQAQFARANASQQNDLRARAASAGALGGNAVPIAAADMAYQQQLGQAPVIAGLYNRSYDQALAAWQQGRGQAAGQLGNLGVAGQQAGLAGAGAQLGAGTVQQQNEQQRLNALYGQFQQAQGFPYQQTQWLAGLQTGVGSQMGGTGTTTTPAPNPWAQFAGAGLTAASMFLRHGGRIRGFAGGGDVDARGGIGAMPYGAVDWLPQIGLTRGRGAPEPPRPMEDKSNPIKDAMGFARNLRRDRGIGAPMDIRYDAASMAGVGEIMPNFTSAWAGVGGSPLYRRGGGVRGFEFGGAPDFEDIGYEAPSSMEDMIVPNRVKTIPYSGVGATSPLSFEERWQPTRDAVSVGDFDPQGMANSSAVAPVKERQPGLVSPVGFPGSKPPSPTPLPQPRPRMAGVAAAPAGWIPAPREGMGPVTPPPRDISSQTAIAPERRGLFGLPAISPELRLPLMTTGLAMMASRSPNLGVAIGEAGLAGVGTYASQQKAREDRAFEEKKFGATERRLDNETKRLDQAAKQAMERLAIDTRRVEVMEGRAEAENWRPSGATTESGHPIWVNSKTGATKNVVTGEAVKPEEKIVSGKDKEGLLSSEAIAVGGRQLAGGDLSPLRNVGRGAQGAQDLAKLRNEAIRVLMAEKGMSADDAAGHMSRELQRFHAAGIGQSAEARTAGTREANLKIILKATQAAIPAALEASENLTRYGGTWVPINRIVQRGQVIASSPELREFGMANLQLAEHWARAMNPTGVMRESDRDLALNFLDTADSKDTYKRVVAQLQKQIERELESVQNVGGHGATTTMPRAAAPAAPAPAAANDQNARALKWANENPNDPRAAAIKKRLGVP